MKNSHSNETILSQIKRKDCPSKLKKLFFSFLCGFLPVYSFAVKDSDLIDHAKSRPEYNSVFKLIAKPFSTNLLKNYESVLGSAVHVKTEEKIVVKKKTKSGRVRHFNKKISHKGIFFTCAHCFDSLLDKNDKTKLSCDLFIKAKVGKKEKNFKVDKFFINPKYFETKDKIQISNLPDDFAILYCKEVASENLPSVKISYLNEEPNSKDYSITAVGFGFKGELDGWLGVADNKKRAVDLMHTIYTKFHNEKGQETLAIQNFTGLEKSEKNNILYLKEVPLGKYEGGTRFGMSGGGVFLQEKNDVKFIGMTGTSYCYPTKTTWEYLSYYLQDTMKKFANIGIHAPFTCPLKAQIELVGTFSFNKDFIEDTIKQILKKD